MIKYTISVRDLIYFFERRGGLSFSNFAVFKKALSNGIWAHQRLQSQRGPAYKKEVKVEYKRIKDDLELRVLGRIDGVYDISGSIIIEEIKSTSRKIIDFINSEHNLHLGQAKLYAAIYAKENSIQKLQTQLTYYHIKTAEIKTIFNEWSVIELDEYLNGLVDKYLDWLISVENHRTKRDLSIKDLEFPYQTHRPGQQELINDVSSIIKNKGQFIAQAPTGIGKTIATLFPSIKAISKKKVSRNIYLTSKVTGQIIAQETINDLIKNGLKIKSVTISAKERICLDPNKDCLSGTCIYGKNYFDNLEKARLEFFRQFLFDQETLISIAKKHKLCPYYLSFEFARWADIIICDFNYLFDPEVSLKSLLIDSLKKDVLLIDEAHNLPERAREMHSAYLSKASFLGNRNN
ncbi:MAG: DEAD/DEAH box helicase [Pseudomonadota bacterium]